MKGAGVCVVEKSLAAGFLEAAVLVGLIPPIHARGATAALTVLVTQPAEHAVRLRDVIEEGRGKCGAAPEAAIGNGDPAHAAGQGDIGEPSLLVAIGVVGGKGARLPGRQEDLGEFEALRLVQCHQADPRGLVLAGAAGRQGRMVKEVAGGVKGAGELEEFAKVLEPVFGGLGLALAQHGAIACRVEEKRELVSEGVRIIRANPPDCIREFQSGGAALGGKRRGFESAEKGDIAEGGREREAGGAG